MKCPLATFQLIIVVCLLFTLTFDATQQSEILIIRHGRSRSRHSIEKDHARWGLKSFSNLTHVENHEGSLEFSEIDANSELNTLNFHVNGKGNIKATSSSIQSQSSEWNGTIGSFEINFTHNPNPKENDGKSVGKQTNFDDWIKQQRTTEMPKSDFLPSSSSIRLLPQSTSSSRQTQTSKEINVVLHGNGIQAEKDGKGTKEHKEEIMLDIKNTVDKGIQYLKSHENLNEIKIEINDFHSTKTNGGRKEHNKIFRTQFIPVAVKMDQISSSYPSNPQHQHQQIQQRLIHDDENIAKQQASEIKINGGKELGIVTILTSQSHLDTRNNVYSHHHPAKQLKSHSPSFASSFESMSDMSQQKQQHQRMRNRQSQNKRDRNQFNSNLLPSNLADVFYVPSSTEEPMLGDQAIDLGDEMKSDLITPTETPISVDKSPKADKKETHSHLISEISQQPRHESHEKVDPDKQETSTASIVFGIDEIENIQNDAETIENNNNGGNYYVEDVEGDPIEVEEFEFDLDLDETSRKNRKNLKRGRDVVTRFLQIVESQHVLGGNCTAGTALNLGEGVVDRYAQDRFRVEAEVAVNRANMLTR